jgi:hypothetical protein
MTAATTIVPPTPVPAPGCSPKVALISLLEVVLGPVVGVAGGLDIAQGKHAGWGVTPQPRVSEACTRG